MKKIVVSLKERSYPVYVGMPLKEIGAHLPREGLARRALVVTNPTVKRRYFAPLAGSLRAAGFTVASCCLPDGERYKRLAAVEKIYRAALAAGLDRRSLVVALGGGVAGDMAGFAAATYLRGVPFVQVPTTLLAMVDSSVGGKTGVDLEEGKNLVGAFYQPKAVFIDTATLATLPLRQVRNGLAEVVKYGVIRDRRFFDYLRRIAARGRMPSPPEYDEIVARCCRIKAAVVKEDEREEKGAREILNFGHTFGHSLETLTGYTQYCHGEAVAAGMVFAARLAQSLGMFGETEALEQVLRSFGLPVAVRGRLPAGRVIAAMLKDKKVRQGKLRFVLPEAIGRVAVREVPEAAVQDVLKKWQGQGKAQRTPE